MSRNDDAVYDGQGKQMNLDEIRQEDRDELLQDLKKEANEEE